MDATELRVFFLECDAKKVVTVAHALDAARGARGLDRRVCAYVACTYVCASQNKNLAVRAPVDMTKGSPAACGSLLKVRTELPLRPLVKTKVQVFFLIPSPCASKNRSSTSRHVNQETRSNRHENVMRSYLRSCWI